MARFVLVHGAFAGAWIWGPLMDRLKAAGHSVEAFDLPGLGDDHTPPSEVTLDSCAARLCEVLAAGSEPAIVVGNSMGGIIATQGAARCPEHVAALVYVSAFLPTDGQSLLDLTKLPEGAGDQVQANIVIEGEPPVAIMPAAASRHALYGALRGGRLGLGDRAAAPATRRAVRDARIHSARSPRRHQPVLRAMHAGSSHPAAVAAADDRRKRMRRSR
jgi:pimeloyl-ACP methyl ester carboxylesterase